MIAILGVVLAMVAALVLAENALYRIFTWRGAAQQMIGAALLVYLVHWWFVATPANGSPGAPALIWVFSGVVIGTLTLGYLAIGVLWIVLFAAREWSKEYMFREYMAWRDRNVRAQKNVLP